MKNKNIINTARARELGMSLIEILIVVAILAILATLIIPNIATSRVKARDAMRKANLKQIQMGLEMYREEHDKNYLGGSGPVRKSNLGPLAGLSPYLPQFANNLDPNDPIYYFNYYTPDSGNTYQLCAYLQFSGDPEKINCTTPSCPCNDADCGTGLKCNYVMRNP